MKGKKRVKERNNNEIKSREECVREREKRKGEKEEREKEKKVRFGSLKRGKILIYFFLTSYVKPSVYLSVYQVCYY